ncbi:alpha-amylase family glycosyl hydrolase, partial [Silvibacterium sp.]|uniref:alpha-amylase family glycosyl hydrolase n=1 Tax=Silvibacterium sp. TaxID=1964179 RepID=UPI0039E2177B
WVSDPPEPDWFHGSKANHRVAQGDFAPLVDPHSPWRDRRDVTEGWFANTLPDMNQENPAVAKYLIQNAVWWTEEGGLDGLRIDTFPYVGRPFWQEFHAELRQLYPQLTTVGEVFNGDPTITSAYAGGVTRAGVDTGLYTPFDFPMHFALLKVFAQKAPMTEIADVLRKDALYPHPERLVPFIGNHDTARFLSEAHGDQTAERLATAVLLTTRGMPELYSGDELAMSGGDDPDNRHDFPGGFTGMKQDGFSPGSRTAEQQAMYAWTNQLLALRAQHPALQTGEEQILYVSDDAIVYLRKEGEERVLVAVHRGAEDVTLHVKTAMTDAERWNSTQNLLGEGSCSAEANGLAIHLPANSALIVKLSQ